jgi:hypothetical protein
LTTIRLRKFNVGAASADTVWSDQSTQDQLGLMQRKTRKRVHPEPAEKKEVRRAGSLFRRPWLADPPYRMNLRDPSAVSASSAISA